MVTAGESQLPALVHFGPELGIAATLGLWLDLKYQSNALR